MKVLVVNCGSSSIKYQLFQMPARTVVAKGLVERIGEGNSALVHEFDSQKHRVQRTVTDHQDGMALILETLLHPQVGAIKELREIGAVGHRVVHGGEEFTGSVVITDQVMASIERFADLAPLHNLPNLVGIHAARQKLPGIPQVACFDTAFHTTIPEIAFLYALPHELYEKYGIRRYGFHGTSHRYVARRAAEIMGRGKYNINCITCHLGNGCSMAAVQNGRSIDTSMGLTPLEGLVMGTRSGDFDPAILFYLADKGYDLAALNHLCNKQSGLLGISGSSNDMRTLSEKAAQGDSRARLAIDIFCYRVRKYLGAYTAVLGTLDAVIFTGGIGENAVQVRHEICRNLDQIGMKIDPVQNQKVVQTEGEISTPDSKVKVFVIPTNEEGAIATDTYQLAREIGP
jgi:acetate kinase